MHPCKLRRGALSVLAILTALAIAVTTAIAVRYATRAHDLSRDPTVGGPSTTNREPAATAPVQGRRAPVEIAATQAQAATRAAEDFAPGQPYRLCPGDVIKISYLNEFGDGKTFAGNVRVDDDGYVVYGSLRFTAIRKTVAVLQWEICEAVAALPNFKTSRPSIEVILVSCSLHHDLPGWKPMVVIRPIRVGDTLDFVFTNVAGNDEEMVTWRVVEPDGTIEILWCGRLTAAGLFPVMLENAIAKASHDNRHPISAVIRIREEPGPPRNGDTKQR